MKHLEDITFSGHELSIAEYERDGVLKYAVDIRADAFDGAYIAGYMDLPSKEMAIYAGKIYVAGYRDGARNYKGQ